MAVMPTVIATVKLSPLCLSSSSSPQSSPQFSCQIQSILPFIQIIFTINNKIINNNIMQNSSSNNNNSNSKNNNNPALSIISSMNCNLPLASNSNSIASSPSPSSSSSNPIARLTTHVLNTNNINHNNSNNNNHNLHNNNGNMKQENCSGPGFAAQNRSSSQFNQQQLQHVYQQQQQQQHQQHQQQQNTVENRFLFGQQQGHQQQQRQQQPPPQQQQQQRFRLQYQSNNSSSLNPHLQQQQQQHHHHQQQQQQQQQEPYCVQCKKLITDRHLLRALEQFWHEDCLKCSCCSCRLGEVGSTLYIKNNEILCKRDYFRMYGPKGTCAACQRPIPAFELVMRARNNSYHLECFACDVCKNQFCVGDRFFLTLDNRVLCENDMKHSKAGNK